MTGYLDYALLSIGLIILVLWIAEIRAQNRTKRERPEDRNPFDQPRRSLDRRFREAGE